MSSFPNFSNLPRAPRETRRNYTICYKGKNQHAGGADFVGLTRMEDGLFYWVKIFKEMRANGEMCLRVELQPKEGE
jgi:hypothetical protein